MVLKEIIKRAPSSTFIEDSWEVKGRPLFLSLLKHYAESGLKIKYIKFDCPLSNEKGEGNYPIQSERFDWKRDVTANDLLKTLSFDAVEEHTTILALDSLSPLLLHCSIKDIIAAVKEIASRKLSVIALLHGDVHEESDIMLLDYAFSCHLSVMKVNGKDACKGTLKRGGKVLDADEFYSVSPNWDLCGIMEIKEIAASGPSDAVKVPLPKSTFKLDLNPNEERARSQVVLPYTRKSTDNSRQEEKKSQIFYEAEQPDWEDEDPDDDLEI